MTKTLDKNTLLRVFTFILAKFIDTFNKPIPCFVKLAKEKGASPWPSVKSLRFSSPVFRDALCLRYGWELNNIPQTRRCRTQFIVDHAMTCHGGSHNSAQRHYCHTTQRRLSQSCDRTSITTSGETLTARSTTADDNARLDIRARGFLTEW